MVLSQVKGLLTNMVSCLVRFGWKPRQATLWEAPNGDTWSFPPSGFPFNHIVHAIQDSIAKILWQKASNHYNGKGLWGGLAWAPTTALIRELRRSNSAKAAALETILAACCWASHRVKVTLQADVEKCPFCGCEDPDDLHTYWTCPQHLESEDPAISATNKYISDAVTQYQEFPCLWFRGLLPTKCVTPRVTPLLEHPIICIGLQKPTHTWPPGQYGTDASGGSHSSIPSLRRVGIGICSLSPQAPFSFQLGVWTALCGDIQTIPRGELYCFVLLAMHAQQDGKYLIYSDSIINIDYYRNGYMHCCRQPNGDLWAQLFSLTRERNLELELVYVPSHIFDKPWLHNSDDSSSEFAILNNTCADALAGYAAGRLECPPSEVTPVVHHIELAKAIQLRLYAVTVLHKPRPKSSIPVDTLKPKLSFDEEVALSSPDLAQSGSRYLCTKCCCSIPCKPFYALLARTQSLCVALPVDAASFRPIAIGMASVQLGKQVAHPTHSLHL